jgi:hypothetical protein
VSISTHLSQGGCLIEVKVDLGQEMRLVGDDLVVHEPIGRSPAARANMAPTNLKDTEELTPPLAPLLVYKFNTDRRQEFRALR